MFQEMMKNFMITQTRLSPDKNVIQYLAFSPLFDKLSRLEPDPQVPHYQINVEVNAENKTVKVTAKKLERSKIATVSKIVDAKGRAIKI